MGAIEVPCANIDCDSEDVKLLESIPTRTDVFEHVFQCNDCDTRFCIATQMLFVRVPKEEDITP